MAYLSGIYRAQSDRWRPTGSLFPPPPKAPQVRGFNSNAGRQEMQRCQTAPSKPKTDLGLYGPSMFETPRVHPDKRDRNAYITQTLLKDRTDELPKMQWQANRRYGWEDLETEMSNKLEESFCNGETVLNMWGAGSFVEFDLRSMMQLPGGAKLRRVKWADKVKIPPPPVDPFLALARADIREDEEKLCKVSDIMRFRVQDPVLIRSIDSKVLPSLAEKARSRWGSPGKEESNEKKVKTNGSPKANKVKSLPSLSRPATAAAL